jgi:hypothetical protein
MNAAFSASLACMPSSGHPHVVEAGFLGGDRRSDRGVQHSGVILAGELSGEQEHPEPHRQTGQQSRSSGLWLSSWPRAEMNAR